MKSVYRPTKGDPVSAQAVVRGAILRGVSLRLTRTCDQVGSLLAVRAAVPGLIHVRGLHFSQSKKMTAGGQFQR
jgi:hypothetical protein